MIETSQILGVADKIARQFHPERIILFGSYAYGTPNEDSDVDLLVVMPYEGCPAVITSEMRGAVRAGFPIDLLVYTPEYIQQRLAWDDFFLIEITRKGKVLYAADYAGVGR